MKVYILVTAIIILLTLGYFGVTLGYEVDGVPVERMTPVGEAPSLTNYLSLLGEEVLYISAVMSASVDNTNPLIVLFFWALNLAVGVVVILIIRGTS